MQIKQFNIKQSGIWIVNKVVSLVKIISSYTIFIVLLILYVTAGVLEYIKTVKLLGPILNKLGLGAVCRGYGAMLAQIDHSTSGEVSRVYMIELALKNLKAKKTRAIITIGGVSVGVGAIVFLVSLGYGLERMVISKVARLDELKILDVGLGEVSSLKMNDDFLKKVSEITDVEEAIPVVGMVSKVRFRNSVSDVMAFGVDQRYIKAVGVKVLSGAEFKDSSISFNYQGGQVAGVNQEIIEVNKGQGIDGRVSRFNVDGNTKLDVYSECDSDSENMGYLIRIEGGFVGERVWGESYHMGKTSNIFVSDVKSGKELSPWIKVKTPLWQVDESGVAVPMMSETGGQKWEMGCIRDWNVSEEEIAVELNKFKTIEEYLFGGMEGQVLGEATASATEAGEASASAMTKLFNVIVATDSAGVEWVELQKVGEAAKPKEDIPYSGIPSGEAYVSSGLVKMFGMDRLSVLGQKFGVSYIIPDGLIPGSSGRLQSQETDYEVKGVVDDDSSNYYYFQITDARMLGVKNYSQVKVLTKDQNNVTEVRKMIEGAGFRTMSTLDTVAQIEKLFGTLRLLLGFLGTIALAVASLGMFNTMTVSLLERTREVGVMKAMGMQITEVRELFLAESMIMGVGGGVIGIMLGYLGGRLLSLILSSISVVKGQGVIDISFIPWFFVAFIMSISFVVGIITGWYPSKRATKISALNALRYE